MAGLIYQYCITKVRRIDFLTTHALQDYREEWDGRWGDTQIPNSYNCYGDPLMETLLANLLVNLEDYTGKKLEPTYSYWRFYQFNDELHRHKDRDSCEISTTLCLGYDVANVDQAIYPGYNWPMWVADSKGNETPVGLNPGDMIVYKGCELDHWREPYKGNNHAQVFLHYNDASNPNNNKFDGRPMLSIPKYFQKGV
jgi:hypothetical protein